MAVQIKIAGVDREVVLKHRQFILDNLSDPKKYLDFTKDMDLLEQGFNVSDADTYFVNAKGDLELVPQENLVEKYMREVGPASVFLQIEDQWPSSGAGPTSKN